MTAATTDDPEATRASTTDPGDVIRTRTIPTLLGLLFWVWLGVHWIYRNPVLDGLLTRLGYGGLLRPDVNVRDREPFLSPVPLETAADSLSELAGALGPAGVPVGWLAWVVDAIALGVAFMPALAAGAWLTVILTLTSILLGLLIAVPLAVARVYGGPGLRGTALGYTELIRGTPLLAQLFVLFFGLPLQGFFDGFDVVGGPVIPSAPVLVAIVGFTINSSAYQAEYIRSALQSVESGQLTAARAVGLSRIQGIRHVVLPQGLRFAIPGWTNEFIYLIKYSSLAAFITVPELFRQARNIGSETFQFTRIYVVVAVFYLALVLTTALAMGRLEATVAIPGLGKSSGRE